MKDKLMSKKESTINFQTVSTTKEDGLMLKSLLKLSKPFKFPKALLSLLNKFRKNFKKTNT
jgi:hypothetical protein